MSLSGMTIAVTGSRRAYELSHIIRSFGGKPYVASTIGIEITERSTDEGKKFILKILRDEFDYVVFMTGPGIYSIMNIAERLGIQKQLINTLNRTLIVCRSEKPAAALLRFGVNVHFILPNENTAEGILKLFLERDLQNKKIAVLWHGSYSGKLGDELQRNGAKVFESFVYTYSERLDTTGADILQKMGFKYEIPIEQNVIRLIEDVTQGTIDAVTFTSPPSARELFIVASRNNLDHLLRNGLNNKTIVVAIGPSTKKILEENRVSVDVMPRLYKMGPMISALSEFVQHKVK
ncbi:MAG: uroporphyrinogen-III synthase [Nitrososphaeraceae archaeon]